MNCYYFADVFLFDLIWYEFFSFFLVQRFFFLSILSFIMECWRFTVLCGSSKYTISTIRPRLNQVYTHRPAILYAMLVCVVVIVCRGKSKISNTILYRIRFHRLVCDRGYATHECVSLAWACCTCVCQYLCDQHTYTTTLRKSTLLVVLGLSLFVCLLFCRVVQNRGLHVGRPLASIFRAELFVSNASIWIFRCVHEISRQ